MNQFSVLVRVTGRTVFWCRLSHMRQAQRVPGVALLHVQCPLLLVLDPDEPKKDGAAYPPAGGYGRAVVDYLRFGYSHLASQARHRLKVSKGSNVLFRIQIVHCVNEPAGLQRPVGLPRLSLHPALLLREVFVKTSHKDSAPILLGLVVQGDAALDHVSASSVFQVFWDTYVNAVLWSSFPTYLQ